MKYRHKYEPVHPHPVTRTRKVDQFVRVCRDCGENVVEVKETE